MRASYYPGTGHRAPGTGHRASGIGHRVPGNGRRTTGHRAPGTDYRAPRTAYRAAAGLALRCNGPRMPRVPPSRRRFLTSAGATLVAAAAAPAVHARQTDVDCVIRSGTVFDGVSVDGRGADVAVRAGGRRLRCGASCRRGHVRVAVRLRVRNRARDGQRHGDATRRRAHAPSAWSAAARERNLGRLRPQDSGLRDHADSDNMLSVP